VKYSYLATKTDVNSSRLSISRKANDTDTSSMGSSEDDLTTRSFTDDSNDERNPQQESPSSDMDVAESKEFLHNIQSALDKLPPIIAVYLAAQMCSIIDSLLRHIAAVQRTGRSCSSSSSNTQNPAADSLDVSTSIGKSRKRSSDDDDDGLNPAENGGNGDGKQQKTSEVSSGGLTKRWACPFYQRNPSYYCMEREFGNYHNCSKSPGNKVHRVK
jgi:hypothetical protein